MPLMVPHASDSLMVPHASESLMVPHASELLTYSLRNLSYGALFDIQFQ